MQIHLFIRFSSTQPEVVINKKLHSHRSVLCFSDTSGSRDGNIMGGNISDGLIDFYGLHRTDPEDSDHPDCSSKARYFCL